MVTVNLENDCIGRYVERLLQAGMGQKPAGALTAEEATTSRILP